MEVSDLAPLITIGIAVIAGVANAAKKKSERRQRDEREAKARAARTAGAGSGAGAGSNSTLGTAPATASSKYNERAAYSLELERMKSAFEPEDMYAEAYAPEATSYDYQSLETEYDAMDGRAPRSAYNGHSVAATERAAQVASAAQSEEGSDGETHSTIREILGDNFDLRRAVIEAEILTPKYL